MPRKDTIMPDNKKLLKLIDKAIKYWTKDYEESNPVWSGSFGRAAITKIQTLQAIKKALNGDLTDLKYHASHLWEEDELMLSQWLRGATNPEVIHNRLDNLSATKRKKVFDQLDKMSKHSNHDKGESVRTIYNRDQITAAHEEKRIDGVD